MPELTYDLLLRLSGGDASVVERLSDDEIDALWVETPVAEYLRREASLPEPRHVFLSGGAGDGKTTLIRKTEQHFDRNTWHIELDASTMTPDQVHDRLVAQLREGKRLLVAINRGQLERLLQIAGSDSELLPVLTAVAEGLRLRVEWRPEHIEALRDVVTIDLSLQDNFQDGVFGELIRRACEAAPPHDPVIATCFLESAELLRRSAVQKKVMDVGQAIQARGHRATMRDLWAFVSHILTGGLPDEPSPRQELSWTDHVGCRIFRQQHRSAGSLTLVMQACDCADPARVPHPALTRDLLSGGLDQLPHPLERHGLVGEGSGAPGGADVVRALWLIGDARVNAAPVQRQDLFTRLVNLTKDEKNSWVQSDRAVRRILELLAALVGHRMHEGELPAWRRLAYEERPRQQAPFVADAIIDRRVMHLGRPRPSPAAMEALGGEDSYFVSYIWLADTPTASWSPQLRLTATMINDALQARDATGTGRSGSEVMAVRLWLSRVRARPLESDRVLVLSPAGRPDQPADVLLILENDEWAMTGADGGTLKVETYAPRHSA